MAWPKIVVSRRVRPISRVGSESALWVGVQVQARPYASGQVGTDPISHGLGWVRVEFFFVVPSAAHST